MCGAWLRRKVPQVWPYGPPLLAMYLATVDCATAKPSLSSSPCIRGGTPKHILNAHLPDQCPQTRIDWWPGSQVPRLPAPIAAKARAMPSHQRLGSDGRHHLHDRWKPSIQLEEEQPIAVRELDPTAHLALKPNQLTSERGILSLKPADRPERRNQQPQKEEEQRDHRGRRHVIPSSDQTDEVFGIHRVQFRSEDHISMIIAN